MTVRERIALLEVNDTDNSDVDMMDPILESQIIYTQKMYFFLNFIMNFVLLLNDIWRVAWQWRGFQILRVCFFECHIFVYVDMFIYFLQTIHNLYGRM